MLTNVIHLIGYPYGSVYNERRYFGSGGSGATSSDGTGLFIILVWLFSKGMSNIFIALLCMDICQHVKTFIHIFAISEDIYLKLEVLDQPYTR